MAVYSEKVINILDGVIDVMSNHPIEFPMISTNQHGMHATDKDNVSATNVVRAQSLDALDSHESRKRKREAVSGSTQSADQSNLSPTPIPRKRRKVQVSPMLNEDGLEPVRRSESDELFISEMSERLAALSATEEDSDDSEQSEPDSLGNKGSDPPSALLRNGVDEVITKLIGKNHASDNADIQRVKDSICALIIGEEIQDTVESMNQSDPRTFAWEKESDSETSSINDTFEMVGDDDTERAFNDSDDSEEEKRDVMKQDKDHHETHTKKTEEQGSIRDFCLFGTCLTAGTILLCQLVALLYSDVSDKFEL